MNLRRLARSQKHAVCGLLAGIALATIFVGCGNGNAATSDGVLITPIASRAIPGPTDIAPGGSTTMLPSPTQPSAPVLSGFTWPIVGACLPQSDLLMPNAPREYRNGIHEGIDFYNADNCAPIAVGTDVVAAKGGTVVRSDTAFVPMTPAQLEQYLANPNTDEALDRFRGRQVWIDHGGGVATRYAHLDGIASGISLGTVVVAGQVIGNVGESGTPESILSPGTEYHLHFELRVGESFLGAGRPPAEVRALYEALFAP